ncbi:MAG TPA: hypothetical protein VFR73_01330 [Hyphomicrobiaceae bacterium]|nr:hypothetical protein [Hyphomicrobiaceae bacterium]
MRPLHEQTAKFATPIQPLSASIAATGTARFSDMELLEKPKGLGMPEARLAWVIGILMMLIVLGGLLSGILLGRLLVRRFRWSRTGRLFAVVGMGAIGAGASLLIVIANFREDIWAPPLQILLNVPQGFSQDWVILLEDSKSPVQLAWTGVEIPFLGKTTTIDVPPSGIARVRDLGAIRGRGGLRVLWSDGSFNRGQAGGPAPQSTGATGFSAFSRATSWSDMPPYLPLGDAQLGAYIAARERGAQ